MPIARFHETDRQAALNSFDSVVNGGDIQIRTGPPPADPTQTPTGTLLVTFTIPADAFAAAAGASGANVTKVLNGTPLSAAAVATGTAGYAAFRTSGGVPRLVGDVTVAGSGGMVELETLSITSGATQTLDSFTLSFPAT